jgi:hypothetical protein
VTDTAIAELAPQLGVRAACKAVGAAQAGYYRRHRQGPVPDRPAPIPHQQRRQPRALTEAEQQAILDLLHSDRFVDLAPAWAGRSCATEHGPKGRAQCRGRIGGRVSYGADYAPCRRSGAS